MKRTEGETSRNGDNGTGDKEESGVFFGKEDVADDEEDACNGESPVVDVLGVGGDSNEEIEGVNREEGGKDSGDKGEG